MTESGHRGLGGPLRRAGVSLLIVVAIGVGVAVGGFLASVASPPASVASATREAPSTAAPGTPAPIASEAPGQTPGSTPNSTPQPTPEPTPEPTPAFASAPLTGLPISPEAARYHAIAVMIDDHRAARPQAGFNAAAVVWHAPAEGGIPRYMLVFQDSLSALVGPIRSARQYFIDWAAEWNAVFVHVGGEPRAQATLRSAGDGELVWNVEERLYEGTYFWRTTDRVVPHNTYSDGEHLRDVSSLIGAGDRRNEPAWTFGPGRRSARPTGTALTVHYPYETITYRYDAASNTYHRFIDISTEPQVDAADGEIVAPSNVVILRMAFDPLNDGHPEKDRLDAKNVGQGEAIISTGGHVIRGRWSKASVRAPTLLFDASGKRATLTPGQTFVQVLPLTYSFEITAGDAPWIRVVPE